MPDTVYTVEFWALVALLLGTVYVLQRITRNTAYRLGATHGFALGIDRTIKTMIKEKLVCDKNGIPYTKDEVLSKIIPTINAEMKKEVEHEV